MTAKAVPAWCAFIHLSVHLPCACHQVVVEVLVGYRELMPFLVDSQRVWGYDEKKVFVSCFSILRLVVDTFALFHPHVAVRFVNHKLGLQLLQLDIPLPVDMIGNLFPLCLTLILLWCVVIFII